jgi:hypothetical protein
MYAVRRWDEDTVIKWLAVGMVLAMVAIDYDAFGCWGTDVLLCPKRYFSK